MNQLRLNSSRQNHTKAIPHPKLERIQITDSKKILAIFSLPADETSVHGGSMQAFVYDHEMEIWTRVSDNKFQYSNFFSTLPETKVSNGLLSRIDQAVKSSFDVRHRRSHLPSSAVYSHCEEQKNNIFSNITKSHCEDRLACALFLKSDEDFQYWLRLYVRQLSLESDVCGIRLLVDVLLSGNSEESSNPSASSWLSSASTILGMNGLKTLQDIVIPEMSKNRSLQRLTNEIATEVNLNRNGL
jgi:protein HIRA/HIR1